MKCASRRKCVTQNIRAIQDLCVNLNIYCLLPITVTVSETFSKRERERLLFRQNTWKWLLFIFSSFSSLLFLKCVCHPSHIIQTTPEGLYFSGLQSALQLHKQAQAWCMDFSACIWLPHILLKEKDQLSCTFHEALEQDCCLLAELAQCTTTATKQNIEQSNSFMVTIYFHAFWTFYVTECLSHKRVTNWCVGWNDQPGIQECLIKCKRLYKILITKKKKQLQQQQ